MKVLVSEHQLNQIFHLIKQEYRIWGPSEIDGKIVFGELSNFRHAPLPLPKSVIPFKSLLYPNHRPLESTLKDEKIAIWGMTNCDAKALQIFLKEFHQTDFLPREMMTIIYHCQPDKDCFCTAFGSEKIDNFDLFIEKEGDHFAIFPGSTIGKEILKSQHLKKNSNEEPPEIVLKNVEKIDKKKLNESVADKASREELWQGIANNCFGCGACTAVCPLCFCTKKKYLNPTDGSCQKCAGWDSCFAKSFSEIQNHNDLRPTNKDRLYNWYHHKFVRAHDKSGHFLCTGCGRCITACPAHLNQHKIMEDLGNNA